MVFIFNHKTVCAWAIVSFALVVVPGRCLWWWNFLILYCSSAQSAYGRVTSPTTFGRTRPPRRGQFPSRERKGCGSSSGVRDCCGCNCCCHLFLLLLLLSSSLLACIVCIIVVRRRSCRWLLQCLHYRNWQLACSSSLYHFDYHLHFHHYLPHLLTWVPSITSDLITWTWLFYLS